MAQDTYGCNQIICWDTVNDIVQRYSGQRGGTASATADPHSDFVRVAENAPPEAVASGLAHAFRSDSTPPFSQMVANLFGQSDPNHAPGC